MSQRAFTGAEPGVPAGAPLERVLACAGRLGPVKKQGKNWRALCPAHDDHHPSLDIAEGREGKVVFICRSRGCTTESIIRAYGLEWDDVFAEAPRKRGEIIRRYPYVDETGELLYEVCRLAPKDFRQRQHLPNHPEADADGWVWSLGNRDKKIPAVQRVLYRLPEVMAAIAEGRTIFVGEGEKDVEAVEAAGGVGTCNSGGAGKFSPELAAMLSGARSVVIIADNDEQGRAHALLVRRLLLDLMPPPEDLRVVSARLGKDAHDHLIRNGLPLEALEPLPDIGEEPAARFWAPKLAEFLAIEDHHAPALVGTADETLITAGGFLLMAGQGGASKTTLSLDAIAHMASGTAWLGWPVDRPVRCLIIENEGPRPKFREKLQSKLDAWQGAAFQDNVYVLAEPWTRFGLDDEGLRRELREFLVQEKIDLVLGDTLDSLGVQGVGSPDETRLFLTWLREVGLFDDVAWWLLHHFNKAPHRDVIQQLSGAWGGHPDAILGVKKEGKHRTKLTWAKLRWATEPEDPVQLLQWQTDTRGFAIVEQQPEVEDDEIHERIAEFLAGVHEASGREVQQGVQGQNKRIGELLKEGLEEGRYVNRSGNIRRPRWALPGDEMQTLPPAKGSVSNASSAERKHQEAFPEDRL